MSAARVLSGHHGGSRNFTSDAAQLLSDEVLVAGAKMAMKVSLTSFTNVIAKGCFGLLVASRDIVRTPRMQFKRAFSVPTSTLRSLTKGPDFQHG